MKKHDWAKIIITVGGIVFLVGMTVYAFRHPKANVTIRVSDGARHTQIPPTAGYTNWGQASAGVLMQNNTIDTTRKPCQPGFDQVMDFDDAHPQGQVKCVPSLPILPFNNVYAGWPGSACDANVVCFGTSESKIRRAWEDHQKQNYPEENSEIDQAGGRVDHVMAERWQKYLDTISTCPHIGEVVRVEVQKTIDGGDYVIRMFGPDSKDIDFDPKTMQPKESSGVCSFWMNGDRVSDVSPY